MLLPLAQMYLRHLLARMGRFLPVDTNMPLTTGDPAVICFFASVSRSYRTLRTMARIALEIQSNAPPDPLFPAAARVLSSFCTALDTVSTHAGRANKHG